MRSFWIYFFILVSTPAVQAHQPEEGKVFGTFGPFLYHTQPQYAPDNPYTPFPLGAALVAEGDLSEYGGIEIGLFYFRKSYDRIFGSSRVVSKIDRVDIPMGYRYWFNSTFSAALEFSSSYAVGDPQIVYSNVINGDQNTLANTLTEYDLNFSLQWQFLTFDRFALVLDARYEYALNANANEDANQVGALIGLKYMIQEKYPESKPEETKYDEIKPKDLRIKDPD